MKIYTIHAQSRDDGECVPLKREAGTKDHAMRGAWVFSASATLCDIVLTQGSKHVVTYSNGVITHLNGKEAKP